MLKTLGKQIKEFKLVSILTPIAMLAEVIVENFIPLLMATIIDSIGSGDLNSIYRTACIMLVLAIAGLISGYLGGVFGANASAGFARNLRKAMFENIQTFSFSNIDKFSTAGLVTRLTTDVTNMQNAYQMILRMAVRAPFSLIVAMIMAFTVSPRLASIYLIAVIILGCICALIIKFAFKYFNQVFKKYDALNESVQENVTAMRVVKAYVREDHEKKKFGKASEAIYKMFVKAEGIVALNNPVMVTTVYTCILLISWVGAHMIVASGNNAALGLTTGNLTSMLAYCMNILMSLMMLSMVFVMITMSMASARRIAEVLNEKPDITNPEDPDFDVPDGSIEFKNVTFRYNSKSEKPILENINVKGALLGLSRKRIQEITEGVIEFAEIGDFLYQPVKKYSSGMKSRLGFSISLYLNPDIIIVDEALSVGDKGFAQKCLDKMNELKDQGKTIVFISHSLPQVRGFCQKAMWIEGGRLKEYGDVEEVCDEYAEYVDFYNSLKKKEKKKLNDEKFESRIVQNPKIGFWEKLLDKMKR